ncbi:MAG: cyanophycinase [Spirochaetales bacterium]|nr:cyanophycinase [Spirochaetales bacterium]
MPGDMVIAGGGLAWHANRILERFCAMSGGLKSRFSILPAASGNPVAACQRMKESLIRLGVPASRIEILPVSPLVPEWAQGAWDEKVVAMLNSADGLWITGGDQSRILQCLVDPERGESPLLKILCQRASRPHAEGGLVAGGSSAGAAVMSDPMICGGTSWGALTLPVALNPSQEEISDPLSLSRGLGLFREGIIDQHFDTRARFARLMAAAMRGNHRRLAFGIDEDTALVYEGANRSISVLGSGGVSVIDVRNTRSESIYLRGRDRRCITNVVWHYLVEGDSLRVSEGLLDFSAKQEILPADAALMVRQPLASGPLSPYGQLMPFAVHMLLDNDPKMLDRDEFSGMPCVRGYLLADSADTARIEGMHEGMQLGNQSIERILHGWEVALLRIMPSSHSQSPTSPEEAMPLQACINDSPGWSRLFHDPESNRYSFSHVGIRFLEFSAFFR